MKRTVLSLTLIAAALVGCGDKVDPKGRALAECSAHFVSASVLAMSMDEDPKGLLDAATRAESAALLALPAAKVREIQVSVINKFKDALKAGDEDAVGIVLESAMRCADTVDDSTTKAPVTHNI